MKDKTRRWVLISGGVTTSAVVGIAAAVLWGSGGDPAAVPFQTPPPSPPGPAAQTFFTALEVGDIVKAAAQTDNPTAAQTALTAQKTGMGESKYQAKVREVTESAAIADVTWSLPNAAPLTYPVEFGMVRQNNQWKVRWTPTVLHPKLADGQHLEFRAANAEGALLDRTGAAFAPDTLPSWLSNAIVSQAGDTSGKPGWEVGIASPNGFTALAGERAVAGAKVTVTIDPAAQRAARAAVDALPQGAAIVAVDTRSTEVLAVARNEAFAGNPFGAQHPPGSTMKIVTGAAAMQAGLVQPGSPVACPAVATVGTRRVENLGFGFDSIPFRTAFAKSCNTTFASLGLQLGPDALPSTARQFGLGADFVMAGADSNTGSVPPASGDGLVENSFGQGTVTASPFGMALVAATVASGRKPTPTLLRGKASPATGLASPPSGAVLTGLRAMMRECVTSGTGTALVKHGNVFGKTGTAESPQGSHGWFVGYRGTVAFAVFVSGAGSSGPAVNAAGQFLAGIG